MVICEPLLYRVFESRPMAADEVDRESFEMAAEEVDRDSFEMAGEVRDRDNDEMAPGERDLDKVATAPGETLRDIIEIEFVYVSSGMPNMSDRNQPDDSLAMAPGEPVFDSREMLPEELDRESVEMARDVRDRDSDEMIADERDLEREATEPGEILRDSVAIAPGETLRESFEIDSTPASLARPVAAPIGLNRSMSSVAVRPIPNGGRMLTDQRRSGRPGADKVDEVIKSLVNPSCFNLLTARSAFSALS
jgi:hypothetical protein